MSIIAVTNIPDKAKLPSIVRALSKPINGHFEALNFTASKTGKVCYVKLSEKLDPARVVAAIKQTTGHGAFIPKRVPDLPNASKRGKIPHKLRKAMRLPTLRPEQVFVITHSEILIEMQTKYSGLFNLSKKTQHKLLESISTRVAERLKSIMESNPEACVSGFTLSKGYRKLHPHFGDFQLVLSTLHRLQDAAGAPRAQIHDQELMAQTPQPYVIDNIPFNQVRQACDKYSERIIKKLLAHINTLPSDLTPLDVEEDIAKKKVREELKKLVPYLPMMVKQVTSNHFVPQKSHFNRMRIYGEPFMPAKEAMQVFLNRFRAVKIVRSDRMYNLLRLNVPLAQHASLAAMDGTVIGGAKLVIRSSDIPLYKTPKWQVKEMKSFFGVIDPDDDKNTDAEQDVDMDGEEWEEDEMAE